MSTRTMQFVFSSREMRLLYQNAPKNAPDAPLEAKPEMTPHLPSSKNVLPATQDLRRFGAAISQDPRIATAMAEAYPGHQIDEFKVTQTRERTNVVAAGDRKTPEGVAKNAKGPVPGTEASKEKEEPSSWTDKTGNFFQKIMDMIASISRYLQGLGSTTLLSVAKALRAMKFNDAAEQLEKLAGGPYAVLKSVLGKKLVEPKKPDDPEDEAAATLYKEQLAAFDGDITALDEHYQNTKGTYASSTEFFRAVYKKFVGEERDKPVTTAELLATIETHKELLVGPRTPTPTPENAPLLAIDTIPEQTDFTKGPVRVDFGSNVQKTLEVKNNRLFVDGTPFAIVQQLNDAQKALFKTLQPEMSLSVLPSAFWKNGQGLQLSGTTTITPTGAPAPQVTPFLSVLSVAELKQLPLVLNGQPGAPAYQLGAFRIERQAS